ncbi:PspA/IM30 family protein [Thermogemmatispora carboxidivorans]|uniref:PspA/IM30 family protein n=1 Tax=Thermogemmatispora carboxidivorans TaxID=1382306 RepID=UPI00069AD585|nr:PspA/IM30 family protein [Thermogemmatispora carboxidivorans]
MNLLERVLTLLHINIDAFIEKAPDPQSSLRQLQLDMRNQLVQVKTQVATAIATAHQLQRRAREKQEEAAAWLQKAEQALRQRNEEAARSALLQYNEVNRLALRYEQQRQAQEHLARTMRDALQQLESRLRELEATSDLLEMKQRQERIQQQVLNERQRLQRDSDQQQHQQEQLQQRLLNERERLQQEINRHRQQRQQQASGVPPRRQPEKAAREQASSPAHAPLSEAVLEPQSPPITEELAPSLSSWESSQRQRESSGLLAIAKELRELQARSHPASEASSAEEAGRRDRAGGKEEAGKSAAPSVSGRTRLGTRKATEKAPRRTTDVSDRRTLADLPLLLETLPPGPRHQDDLPE